MGAESQGMGKLNPNMNPEAFRDEAGRLLDYTISRLVLSEDEKTLLRALRTHVRTADESEIRRVQGLI